MNERKARIAEALRVAREDLVAVIGGVKGSDWQKPTPCAGWSVKDLVAHVAIGETGNMAIMQRILNGEGQAVAGFDLDRYNQRQVEKRRDKSTSDVIEDLAAGRRQLLAVLDELSDEQLSAVGHRTTGEATTVEGVFFRLVEHDRAHTEHLRQALAAER